MIENNLDAINGHSEFSFSEEESSEIPLKDKFFMSDLEKYYKYGKYPYMFFFQLFLIVLSTDDLSLFRYHIRTMDSTFMPEPYFEPSWDSKRELIINGVEDLNTHIDFIISKIFDFEECFAHNLKLIDLNKLSLDLHQHRSSYKNKTTVQLKIKNKDDNPLRKIGDNEEIRNYITHVQTIQIPIRYFMNVSSRGRKLRLIWSSFMIFDFNSRGLIKFRTIHEFKYFKEEERFFKHIYHNFIDDFGLLNLIVIILSLLQVYIITRRLYSGYKALIKIKQKLDRIIEHEEEDSILNFEEDDHHKVLARGKTKWEMLKLNDKSKFFNLWYFIILSANFFQIISSVNHVFFPVLNETNQFLCGTSCLLSWFGCGYFLEYEEKYYFFYLTIKKSVKMHFKYVVVFILIFSGYAILMACTFNYSELYYSNLHMSFITCFSALVGDKLLNYWTSTMHLDPLKTIIFSFFFFLIFVAFFLRMMVSITEESFDCIKMRKNFYWLDKKLSIKDYIKHEMDFKNKDDDNKLDENRHYMLSNAIMNIIMSFDKYSDKLPEELQNVFKAKVDMMKERGLAEEEVNMIVKKDFKKLVKESKTHKSSDKLLDHDFVADSHKLDLKFGKTDSVKMQHVYELIDGLFINIENLFKRLDEFVKTNQNKLKRNDYQIIINKIVSFSDKVLTRLLKIKQFK